MTVDSSDITSSKNARAQRRPSAQTTPDNPAARPLITATGLRKVFDTPTGTVEAIGSADFSISTGEFVSLLGPSGCGKSTLLMMVAGLEPATGGSIVIDGSPVSRPRCDVGIVYQEPVLLPWKTVLQNVLFPIQIQKLSKADHLDKARTLLGSVGLGRFLDKKPHELSGGMRQRVAICRALINDPAVLLMDEPFSALDTITREQMTVLLMTLWEEVRKSALFVTHSIREAVYLSDRVLVMGKHPSTVFWTERIPFPRPRPLSIEETAEFNAICSTLRLKIDEALGASAMPHVEEHRSACAAMGLEA
jgi:NitT/TauT family transport system ATP-binding protein